ncbi:hypothetical protein AC1031_014779 [Aphanomyces cochlioides]|nr:hypothetical protein AC1031_014779 [Aphanomyces cochlioides]
MCGMLATPQFAKEHDTEESMTLKMTTPATSQSTVSKGKQGDEKRRNWTEDEDIVLLRQVAADLPCLAPYGKILACWDTVAKTLLSSGCLARSIGGQKAQNRFFFLLDEHRKYDLSSARKFGVDETTSEKIDLLDDLLVMYDDNKMEQEKKLKIKEWSAKKMNCTALLYERPHLLE